MNGKEALSASHIWKANTADGKVFCCYFYTDGCIIFTEGMILGASFSNVIFYICKCKWVPAYHLCMQMIDLAFAHQAQISSGHYPTDGQIRCELHLFKERQATNPFKKMVSGFVYSQQHRAAEVNIYSYTFLWREFFHLLGLLLLPCFPKIWHHLVQLCIAETKTVF